MYYGIEQKKLSRFAGASSPKPGSGQLGSSSIWCLEFLSAYGTLDRVWTIWGPDVYFFNVVVAHILAPARGLVKNFVVNFFSSIP